MKKVKALICLCVIAAVAVGGFLFWRHMRDEKAAALAAERLRAVTVKGRAPRHEPEPPLPEEPPEPELSARQDILDLMAQNPDTVGYIKIDDTKIDYPVVQSGDNNYYLTHTFEGENADRGAIFADSNLELKQNPEELPRHLLIHGHHMRNGSMFHNISLYKGRQFFYDHSLVDYETLYYDTEWEIFSVYVVNSDEYVPMTFKSDEEFIAYAEKIAGRSIFPVDVSFTADDRIMTLNTCSYEFSGAHTLVAAKLVSGL